VKRIHPGCLVTPKYDKWRQLVLGLICMAAISSPQYVWTLLTIFRGNQRFAECRHVVLRFQLADFRETHSPWMPHGRQLVLGLICMAAISSPQYVWTLLTKPLAARLGVGSLSVVMLFSVFS
jgi:hypothetical protein